MIMHNKTATQKPSLAEQTEQALQEFVSSLSRDAQKTVGGSFERLLSSDITSNAIDIKDLQWGLEQVKAGKIKPALDRTLSLSQAAEAHRLIANNEVTGNIVLLPWVD